jgi:Flp pilus assembly pilin Flp
MLQRTMTNDVRNLMANRRNDRRRGQGMTDYIIIVGVIAILLVAAVMNFKNALNNAFDRGQNKIQSDIVNQMN